MEYEQIMEALRNAHAAGDEQAARRLARMAQEARAAQNPPQERGFWRAVGDNLIGFDDGVQSPGENVGQFINRAIETATFGLVGDEAAAAADAAIGRIGEGRVPYEDALTQRRDAEDRFSQQHPYATIAADLAGAIAPGAGIAAGARAGMGLLGRSALGGVAGGLAGGLTGFMEGEGGVPQRISNMPVPAAVGAGVGTALPGLGRAAESAWRAVGPGAARALRGAQDRLGLERFGTEVVSDAIGRDLPYSAERLQAAGPRAINAQTGENTMGLLDWVMRRPGEAAARASNRIAEIAGEAGQDLRGTLDTLMGLPEGVARTTRGIMRETADARRQAYNAAYSQPINYASPQGQRLLDLLGRVDDATIRRAQTLMRAEGAENLQRIVSIADDGTVTFTTPPDVQTIDYITRALRRTGAAGNTPEVSNALEGLSRELRGQLDELVPEYRTARAEGRDAIANREAVEFGSNLLGRNIPQDVAEDTIEAMTEAEIAYARQGVRSYLDEIMANTQRALTDANMDAREAMRPMREILSAAGQRKLRALMGEDADRLIETAERTYQALSMRANLARNSATFERATREQQLQEAFPRGASEVLQEGGGILGAVQAMARPVLGNPALPRLARQDEAVSRMADVLLAPVGSPTGTSLGPVLQQLPGLLSAANSAASNVGRRVIQSGGLLGALGSAQTAR